MSVVRLPWIIAGAVVGVGAAGSAAALPDDEAPRTWGSGAPTAPAGASASAAPSGDAPPGPAPDQPPPARGPRRPAAAAPPPVEDEAVRYTLEAVEVRGNQRTAGRVLLRYIPFQPGDVFDVEDPRLTIARYRLLGTGFFRDVQFALRRGSERGRVVLVVEVVERNTIIVHDLWMGLSADADTRGNAKPLTAFAGLDVAETNLAGTGITLGGALAVGRDQLALRMRYFDPALLGTPWMASAALLYADALDFFGNADVRYVPVGQLQLEAVTDYAVVDYSRLGGSFGLGRDLSPATQLWGHYRIERVAALVPAAASHLRGDRREPIEFDIVPGESNLVTLGTSLQLDTRDHPVLPTQGWWVTGSTEVAARPIGSDYSYTRFELSASRWWRVPWARHVLRLQAFGGAIAGDAPFFEQYYVGDYTDFLPSRVLGLTFDRRPAPGFLGTTIREVRYGEAAALLGTEYRVPLYRGSRSVFGIDFFGSLAAFAVAGDRDITSPAGGYSGFQLFPVDLTANLGVRMDTAAGGFLFTVSNIAGFVPVRAEDAR